MGKSAGLDTLQAEHFKHADDSINCLLSMLLNSILTHGYMPEDMIETLIVPILKDKKRELDR